MTDVNQDKEKKSTRLESEISQGGGVSKMNISAIRSLVWVGARKSL